MAKKRGKPNSSGCLTKEQSKARKAKRHAKRLEYFAKRRVKKEALKISIYYRGKYEK